MPEFHQLPGSDIEEADVRIARARALLEAVRGARDFALIGLRAIEHRDGRRMEWIMIEVEVDRVPPKNRHGILYRERLALCVAEDPRSLVEVLALRKDFPILIHQNQGVRDGPASLCLYFEAPKAVLRTWTPENFLRRVQWWLEASSRDELHPADQAVEGLFFAAKTELVLPWGAAQSPWGKEEQVVIYRDQERPDGSGTLFLDRPSGGKSNKTVAHVRVETSPVLHGFVERDPSTLGELAEILQHRGVQLLNALKPILQERVSPQGCLESEDDKLTVVLLRVPVCRIAGGAPERHSHKAYCVGAGPLRLGLATGALIKTRTKNEERVFSGVGVLDGLEPNEWKAIEVMPMEVLHRVDASMARKQSGIDTEGGPAVLVGAGSLGSAMLNLFARSGWGMWTVVDKDHVKPHNLVRHVAFAPQIGRPKASVIADLCSPQSLGMSVVSARVGDACETELADGFREAQFVVDASAGLDYPRYASTRDDLPRHVSAFVTPNGESAVLMLEDAARKIRLRSLEAQYYRAIINNNWGHRHLDGNLGSFWSGASCRDISFVLPYSRVIGHAAVLAEQLREHVANEGARLRVWQRDSGTGAVEMFEVAVTEERRFEVGRLDCHIDLGLEQKVRAMRQHALPNETGGVLLGYYDFNVKSMVVVDALPAPTDSRASPHGFERGVEGLAATVKEAARRTAGIVGYVGEWHSHPRGVSTDPSREDIIQLVHLTFGMAADGLPAVQMIVGDSDISILQGVTV